MWSKLCFSWRIYLKRIFISYQKVHSCLLHFHLVILVKTWNAKLKFAVLQNFTYLYMKKSKATQRNWNNNYTFIFKSKYIFYWVPLNTSRMIFVTFKYFFNREPVTHTWLDKLLINNIYFRIFNNGTKYVF